MDDDRSGTSVRTADQGALGSVPGAVGLLGAVSRVRRELAFYRPSLPERVVAEDELDALARQAATSAPPDPEALRHSLLLVAAALGSVSALWPALASLREAVETMTPSN